MKKVCTILKCQRAVHSLGYCWNHKEQLLKFGKVTPQFYNSNFSIDEKIQRFWSKVAITANPNNCWEWQGKVTDQGYGSVWITHLGRTAHRISWALANGKQPSQPILHSCDNRLCVNPSHLREGSNFENVQDRQIRHRQAKGEKLSFSKLTDSLVAEIKGLLVKDFKQTEIAKKYGVCSQTISAIARGKTWKHI